MPQQTDAAVSIPQPPRPITRNARRRSWGERHVRVWWLVALAIALVAIYVTAAQIINSTKDRWLIEKGLKLDAEVVGIENVGPGKTVGPEFNGIFTLRFMKPGTGTPGAVTTEARDKNAVSAPAAQGQSNEFYKTNELYLAFTSGKLKGITRRISGFKAGNFTLTKELPQPPAAGDGILFDCEPVALKSRLKDQRGQLGFDLPPEFSVITLSVDPNDFSRWTDRQSASLMEHLLVAIWLLPAAIVLFIVALIHRQQVLRTWRDGQLLAAVVVEARQWALAPRSRLVRFSLRESRDRRIYGALWPNRLGVPQRGEMISLVARPNRPDRALVAQLYG